MARTAHEAAIVLREIHDECFGNDLGENYKIPWERMRELCGIRRLNKTYLNELTDELNELGFSLAPFDDYLLILKEGDCAELRSVPGRIVENYLPGDGPVMGNDPEDEGDHEVLEDEDA